MNNEEKKEEKNSEKNNEKKEGNLAQKYRASKYNFIKNTKDFLVNNNSVNNKKT
jgi:hypothetical protein